MSDIEIKGLDDLLATFHRLGDGADNACAGPVKDEADEIMKDSKGNYVPYEEGDLQESGYVAEPEIRGDVVSVEMGYNTPYALVQHEDLSFQHPGGKSAKYLERPLLDAERGMDERLARDIRTEIERLVR